MRLPSFIVSSGIMVPIVSGARPPPPPRPLPPRLSPLLPPLPPLALSRRQQDLSRPRRGEILLSAGERTGTPSQPARPHPTPPHPADRRISPAPTRRHPALGGKENRRTPHSQTVPHPTPPTAGSLPPHRGRDPALG